MKTNTVGVAVVFLGLAATLTWVVLLGYGIFKLVEFAV